MPLTRTRRYPVGGGLRDSGRKPDENQTETRQKPDVKPDVKQKGTRQKPGGNRAMKGLHHCFRNIEVPIVPSRPRTRTKYTPLTSVETSNLLPSSYCISSMVLPNWSITIILAGAARDSLLN